MPQLFRPLRATPALLALLLVACGPKYIPHTTIVDTADHREILDIIRQYRQAFEARDAETITLLLSDRYLDRRDSLSKEILIEQLQDDFDKVREIQLDINVRRLDVEGDDAQLDYFYSTSFLLKAGDATWQTETDDKRMHLVREEGEWKILSGL